MFFVLAAGGLGVRLAPEPAQAGAAFGSVLVAGWMVILRAPGVPWTEALWLSFPLAGSSCSSVAAARRAEQVRLAEERADRTEEEVRLAVSEERNRITRELHDVLAHSVSVMTVQASAVRRRLTAEQEREREALSSSRRPVARRSPRCGGSWGSCAPRRPPRSRRSRASARCRRSSSRCASGLPVELTVEGTWPAAAGHRPLRLSDRAGGLTNTLKHAGPAPRLGRRSLCRRRRRDRGRERRPLGRGGRRRRPRAGRHAERVAMCGGESPPAPGGGYRISPPVAGSA